jgi:hypothetical protein
LKRVLTRYLIAARSVVRPPATGCSEYSTSMMSKYWPPMRT